MALRKVQRGIIGLVSAALVVTMGVLPASAQADNDRAANSATPQTVVAGLPKSSDSLGETQGIKSFFIKKALQGVAGLVRGGASAFIRIGGRFLDDGAERILRTRSDDVADVIDDVAGFPDIATHQIRSLTYTGLVNAGIPTGSANVIANAVEGVFWILL